MRLRKFRVRAYRCIHDSGQISIGDLAAFIGRNESGKTTILQALTLLNKEESISELDLCDEMSEELKTEIRIAEGEFELNKHEIDIIHEKFNDIAKINKIKIFRTNRNPEIQYDFGDTKIDTNMDENLKTRENFANKILEFIETIPNHIRIRLNAEFLKEPLQLNFENFKKKIWEINNNLMVLASVEQKVISEWNKIYNEKELDDLLIGRTKIDMLKNFIKENLHPRFVYFSDYKKIYGNINLNEYLSEVTNHKIEYKEEFDKTETVMNLFYLAELEIEKIKEYKDSPSRLIKFLNTSSNRLTTRLNPAWKGESIHVDLRYNPGNIMSVVISDVHKDGTITNTGLLSRRAEGFKWIFSFIVNFAAETQRAELKEAILLLDEPARNLHPTQQIGIADLLKNLAGSNQILYATHSPYMVFDYTPGNLLVVELDKKKHLSRIFYDYWNADNKTLIPIIYGLSKGLVESITDKQIGINSRPIIIVETISDCMYLNSFDKLLQDPNISMNPLNIVAAYNKNSVLPLAIFYRNHGYRTFVILDNSDESKHISDQLISNKFSSIQTIFFEHNDNIQTIEDYMSIEDYLFAVNQTYEIKLRHEGYNDITIEKIAHVGKKGIIENLEYIWSENERWGKFSNEEITRYVCEKIASNNVDFISDKTKERFRTLYRLIAERIRQYKE
ncbi:MAG: AAA family ATPase [Thaumarchaeota archaeon]|nr:AAA family ATPase [Nitrososphaerota archaeon]